MFKIRFLPTITLNQPFKQMNWYENQNIDFLLASPTKRIWYYFKYYYCFMFLFLPPTFFYVVLLFPN